jgi:cytochrome c556
MRAVDDRQKAEPSMKPVLLTASVAALIAVAACSGGNSSSSANGSAGGNGAVPDAQTGNTVATPPGGITAANAYDIRHERYEEMGDSMKAISRELKGSAPDVGRIQREAATLATLASQIPTWFPDGSGPDASPKTRAKAEIWSNPEGFRQAHESYLRQTESFKRVADGGDIEQIRAAAQELGKSCSNCHDDFRGPER